MPRETSQTQPRIYGWVSLFIGSTTRQREKNIIIIIINLKKKQFFVVNKN